MRRLISLCLIFSMVVFALSCGESKKENVYSYPDEDSNDADTVTDATDSADDSDSTDPATDNDSDSGKKPGELYGECYPNKTCNEGLVCDEEHNICIKDPGNTEKPDDDSDNPNDPNDNDHDTNQQDNDIIVIDDTDTTPSRS